MNAEHSVIRDTALVGTGVVAVTCGILGWRHAATELHPEADIWLIAAASVLFAAAIAGFVVIIFTPDKSRRYAALRLFLTTVGLTYSVICIAAATRLDPEVELDDRDPTTRWIMRVFGVGLIVTAVAVVGYVIVRARRARSPGTALADEGISE